MAAFFNSKFDTQHVRLADIALNLVSLAIACFGLSVCILGFVRDDSKVTTNALSIIIAIATLDSVASVIIYVKSIDQVMWTPCCCCHRTPHVSALS